MTNHDGTTHAEGCYRWGPRHYDCALRVIERLERELAEARSTRSVTLPEDPRELLVTTARDAGFSDAQWKSMFYERGPYDITFPSSTMKKFVRLLLERLQSPADQPEGER